MQDVNKMRPPFQQVQPQEFPGVESEMELEPDFGEHSYTGRNRLTGKVALITGADSGIGRAVAVAFAKEGCEAIAIGYLKEDTDANETKRVVEAQGAKCILVAADVSEEAECKRLVDETIKAYGRVDILVNNAAFQGKQVDKFEDINYDRLLYTFKTNMLGYWLVTKYCLPHMTKGSAIINSGSIQAYDPSSSILDYSCTKGAIISFTKGLSRELVSRGIRVNCVAPGPVWTPLIVQSFKKEKIEQFGKQTPKQRPAQPVEMAPCYVFLASQESNFVVGEILGATGGMLLG